MHYMVSCERKRVNTAKGEVTYIHHAKSGAKHRHNGNTTSELLTVALSTRCFNPDTLDSKLGGGLIDDQGAGLAHQVAESFVVGGFIAKKANLVTHKWVGGNKNLRLDFVHPERALVGEKICCLVVKQLLGSRPQSCGHLEFW